MRAAQLRYPQRVDAHSPARRFLRRCPPDSIPSHVGAVRFGQTDRYRAAGQSAQIRRRIRSDRRCTVSGRLGTQHPKRRSRRLLRRDRPIQSDRPTPDRRFDQNPSGRLRPDGRPQGPDGGSRTSDFSDPGRPQLQPSPERLCDPQGIARTDRFSHAGRTIGLRGHDPLPRLRHHDRRSAQRGVDHPGRPAQYGKNSLRHEHRRASRDEGRSPDAVRQPRNELDRVGRPTSMLDRQSQRLAHAGRHNHP